MNKKIGKIELDMPDEVTVRQAAIILGIAKRGEEYNRAYILNLIAKGRIKSRRDAHGYHLISKEELTKFANEEDRPRGRNAKKILKSS